MADHRHFPRRVVVAVTEVLAAIVLVGLAWWCWHHGLSVMVRRGVGLIRVDGRWWATATSAVTLAGLLLLDAGREALLALRAD